MDDLELTKAAAEFCGIDTYHWSQDFDSYKEYHDFQMKHHGKVKYGEKDFEKCFDPLHDRNDLEKVEVGLPTGYMIVIEPELQSFELRNHTEDWGVEGSYPSDYPRAVLELVYQLQKEKEDGT